MVVLLWSRRCGSSHCGIIATLLSCHVHRVVVAASSCHHIVVVVVRGHGRLSLGGVT